MTRGARALALLSAALLFSLACTSTGSNPTANVSPSSGASTGSSPSSSPSSAPESSPTSAATSTPAGAPLAITSLPFHNGEVGVSYSAISLGATGGAPPYSWSISAGLMPAGVGLSSAGVVNGTPSAAGNSSFTVTVQDSAGGSAAKAGSINVAAHLLATALCASMCSVEAGCTVCGAFGSVSGGAGPYTYKITQGSIPPGMGLNGFTVTGAFPSGGVGAYNLSVVIKDQFGVQQQVDAQWFVFPHIAFSVGSAQCGPGYGCRIQIPYTMGTPNGTPTITFSRISCGNPPCTGVAPEPAANTLLTWKGFTYSIGGGAITIDFLSPGTYGDWVGSFSLTITDQSLCGPGSAKCSATITVVVDSERRFG